MAEKFRSSIRSRSSGGSMMPPPVAASVEMREIDYGRQGEPPRVSRRR